MKRILSINVVIHCALSLLFKLAYKLDIHIHTELDKTDLFLKTKMWCSLLNLYMYFTLKNHHWKLFTRRIYNNSVRSQLHMKESFFHITALFKTFQLSDAVYCIVTWIFGWKTHPMNRFLVGWGGWGTNQSQAELGLKLIRLLQLECGFWSAAQSLPLLD